MEPLREIANGADNRSNKPRKILIVLFLGFLIAVLGIMILIIAGFIGGGGSSSFSFGIVIFIGPIPIIVGAGPEAQWLILFAIVLTVLSIAMFMTMRRQTK